MPAVSAVSPQKTVPPPSKYTIGSTAAKGGVLLGTTLGNLFSIPLETALIHGSPFQNVTYDYIQNNILGNMQYPAGLFQSIYDLKQHILDMIPKIDIPQIPDIPSIPGQPDIQIPEIPDINGGIRDIADKALTAGFDLGLMGIFSGAGAFLGPGIGVFISRLFLFARNCTRRVSGQIPIDAQYKSVGISSSASYGALGASVLMATKGGLLGAGLGVPGIVGGVVLGLMLGSLVGSISGALGAIVYNIYTKPFR